MASEIIKKHFCFNEKDIADGKFTAWNLIQPLWFSVSIYDGLEKYEEDLKQFTDGQRKIFALMWYGVEVCNGGHDQFFLNSTGIVWKDALEGLKMIGAVELANNLQKAVDLFGGHIPFDRGQRMEKLRKLDEDENFDSFDEIDNLYYCYDEASLILMNEYVKKHPKDFVLDGKYDYCEI